ncbi:hypothetical protein [Burkholderia gladioli]|uniref:hypothetical protein n=1 Tax=Burkholderia gladioli TaxID=28095 RepID=UPI001640AE1C|nr:hypothetical protein [Burkholderia gladioli]
MDEKSVNFIFSKLAESQARDDLQRTAITLLFAILDVPAQQAVLDAFAKARTRMTEKAESEAPQSPTADAYRAALAKYGDELETHLLRTQRGERSIQ